MSFCLRHPVGQNKGEGATILVKKGVARFAQNGFSQNHNFVAAGLAQNGFAQNGFTQNDLCPKLDLLRMDFLRMDLVRINSVSN
jgi:hypothetical protein